MKALFESNLFYLVTRCYKEMDKICPFRFDVLPASISFPHRKSFYKNAGYAKDGIYR